MPSRSLPEATTTSSPRTRCVRTALALVVGLLGGCATTDDQGVKRDEALFLTVANDIFTGSDNNFSSGVGLSYQTDRRSQYGEDSALDAWFRFWSFLPGFDPDGDESYATWTLGQEIFTPNNIETPTPPLNDQPYAGVLFLDSTLYSRRANIAHAWNLRLGIVGPSSLAEQSQREAHELIGSAEPLGWDTQLPDEPILNLDYTVAAEWLEGGLVGDCSWRLVPLAGASAGTYFTGVSTGAYLEAGWNLPQTVGLLSIRRGMDALAAKPQPDTTWSLSFFIGGGAFGVAHYLPLDGTVFRESRSVRSEPLVEFLSTGITWRTRWCTLAFLLTEFGTTFETERQSTEYGTLTLSWTL